MNTVAAVLFHQTQLPGLYQFQELYHQRLRVLDFHWEAPHKTVVDYPGDESKKMFEEDCDLFADDA